MFTLTLLPRVAASSLLALKVSCGAGEDVGDTLDVSSTTVAASSSTDVSDTPPTTTEDPGTVTEIGSTGPASTTGSVTGTGTGTSVASTGDETDSFGESTGSGGLPDGQCRSDMDCDATNFESCYSADDPYCGPCQLDQEECLADRDCGEGVCEEIAIDCGCDGPTNHVCVPRCAGPADCEEGEACDLETGRCEPITCGEGATCDPLFDCVAGSGGDDCVRRECADDRGCDGGVCVEGRCFAAYGTCMQPGA